MTPPDVGEAAVAAAGVGEVVRVVPEVLQGSNEVPCLLVRDRS